MTDDVTRVSDADIIEFQTLYRRATGGTWLMGVDRNKNPVVVDHQGRVIIDGDAYAEDIRLIVAMHRLYPALILERELAGARHLRALRDLEKQANDLREEMTHAREVAETAIGELTNALAEVRAQLEAAQADLPRLRRAAEEHEQMVPLVSTVKNWHRTRYTPGLVAAVERYIAWEQTRETK